jgi:O-6-methylguanine DNA methyltransferase
MATMPTTGAAVLGTIDTPIGRFGAAFSPAGLGQLAAPRQPFAACEAWVRRWLPDAPVLDESPWLEQLSIELNAYFAGALRTFSIPLDLRGTPFQQDVWRTLQTIPYGEVWSYTQLAHAIGRPKAVRAVGAANALNPVAILVPCHRLIGSDGALRGYAGGLELKQQLLQLEGALDRAAPPSADARQRYRVQYASQV